MATFAAQMSERMTRMVEQVTERAHQASEVAGQVKTWVCGTGVHFSRGQWSSKNPIFKIASFLGDRTYTSPIKACVDKNGEIYIVYNTFIGAACRTVTGQPTIKELFLAGLPEGMVNATAMEVGNAVADVINSYGWKPADGKRIALNFRQLAASYIEKEWGRSCFDVINARLTEIFLLKHTN